MRQLLSIFVIFLRLGCTSFGGPVAHLGYFREEFVARRQWLSEAAFANLIALCQFIPGPASSQVGAAIGFHRAGYGGAVVAWLGFTLPSAILLVAAALFFAESIDTETIHYLHGLKLVAVAVVAHAVWGMQKTLCPDLYRRLIAIASAITLLLVTETWAQVILIVVGAGIGLWLFRNVELPASRQSTRTSSTSRRISVTLLLLFVLLLVGLPLVSNDAGLLDVFDSLFRAGALVFGGGHVVLPLLSTELVDPGTVDTSTFLFGYALAQAVPGPLFTFATFLGATIATQAPITGAVIATLAIFLPGMLLLFGILPFWQALSNVRPVQAALAGVNAVVVGLLLSTLISPIGISALTSWLDIVLASAGFIALTVFKLRGLIVIILLPLLHAGLTLLVV